MSKQIAQVKPRSASRSLLRAVLQQACVIDAKQAEAIARLHLGRSLDGANHAAWPSVMTDDAFADAFRAGMMVIVDRCARREGKPPMTKVEYDLLCYCVITCSTLREVIARARSFMHALASRPARLALEIDDGVAEFRIETDYAHRDLIGLLTDLAGLAAFHRLFAWLIDTPVPLLGVRMGYPALIDNAAAAFMIPFPISYGAETNALRFPAELLDRPVLRNPQQLTLLLARFPFDVNATNEAHDTLANQVRSLMAASLSKPETPPTEREMANRLGVSLSTLKRRLHAEKTNYRSIRESLLRTLATACLTSERYSIETLSRRLGFSDVSSFRHAFKRWTGCAPNNYKKIYKNVQSIKGENI